MGVRMVAQENLRKLKQGNDPLSMATTKYSCEIHAIQFVVPNIGLVAECPVCVADHRIAALQKSVRELSNQLSIVSSQAERMKVQIDITSAIKQALPITSSADTTFMKSVLYRWREDRSISLKITHGPRTKRRPKPPITGFMAVPRPGEPEGYLCTSLGGLAIASYLEEAQHMVGSAQSMTLMIRAFDLPGAME